MLSPLGVDFDARDLIAALRATALVVCPNRLGAINQALLVVRALTPRAAARAQVVLVSPPNPDASARSNPGLLAEALGSGRVHVLPWLSAAQIRGRAPISLRIRRTLNALLA